MIVLDAVNVRTESASIDPSEMVDRLLTLDVVAVESVHLSEIDHDILCVLARDVQTVFTQARDRPGLTDGLPVDQLQRLPPAVEFVTDVEQFAAGFDVHISTSRKQWMTADLGQLAECSDCHHRPFRTDVLTEIRSLTVFHQFGESCDLTVAHRLFDLFRSFRLVDPFLFLCFLSAEIRFRRFQHRVELFHRESERFRSFPHGALCSCLRQFVSAFTKEAERKSVAERFSVELLKCCLDRLSVQCVVRHRF